HRPRAARPRAPPGGSRSHGRGRAGATEGRGRRGRPFGPRLRALIVQKYGGTSVGTAARIRRVSRRIAETVRSGEKVVAVVSAMGHTTDRLIELAHQVTAEA